MICFGRWKNANGCNQNAAIVMNMYAFMLKGNNLILTRREIKWRGFFFLSLSFPLLHWQCPVHQFAHKFLSVSIAIKDNAIMDFSLTLATGWRTFSHLWFHGPCSVMFGRHWRARCWFYIHEIMKLINFVGLTALFQHTSMFQTKSTGAVKGWVQTGG